MDPRKEWYLPLLQRLQLGCLKTMPTKLRRKKRTFVPPYHLSFQIAGLACLQKLSLEWATRDQGGHSEGDEKVALLITKGTTLRILTTAPVSILSIVAPGATELVCGGRMNGAHPSVLELKCPLIERLVMRGWGDEILEWQEKIEQMAHKECPSLKEVK